jgi:cytochrome c
VVPGTSMVFAGLPNPADRKAVIAYLKKPVP